MSKANHKSCIIRIEFNLVAARDLRLSRYERWESLLAAEAVEDLRVRCVGEMVTRQSRTDKTPALTNRFQSREEFDSGVGFRQRSQVPRNG